MLELDQILRANELSISLVAGARTRAPLCACLLACLLREMAEWWKADLPAWPRAAPALSRGGSRLMSARTALPVALAPSGAAGPGGRAPSAPRLPRADRP
jgi:hypothetical protein